MSYKASYADVLKGGKKSTNTRYRFNLHDISRKSTLSSRKLPNKFDHYNKIRAEIRQKLNKEQLSCNNYEYYPDFVLKFDYSKSMKLGHYISNNKSTGMFMKDHVRINNEENCCFKDLLRTEPSKKILNSVNAGGNSEVSESFSALYMSMQFGGCELKSEMEIKYITESKIIDYIINIYGVKVGVSVTRAMGYPHESRFTREDANELITKKLNGLVMAQNNTHESDKYNVAILHVISMSPRITELVEKTYRELQGNYNVILIATVCSYSDIYTNEI